MRPGREIDKTIAELVFHHEVFTQKRIPYEKTSKGDRPLRNYSKEIGAAWEVVEKLGMTLIPIENGSWFALVGKEEGFAGPAEFMEFLQKGDFVNSGAAVGESAPMTICLAAIKALSSRIANLSPVNSEIQPQLSVSDPDPGLQ